MDPHDSADDVIAEISASPLRRGFAYVVLVAVAVILFYLAFWRLGGSPGSLVLAALGALAFWLAEAARMATRASLILTAEALCDSTGAVLARMDQVVAVDRGPFAFKPSNGFALTLSDAPPRAWRPGLWWRFGRRVGVGGVISASAAKFLAEQIALQATGRLPQG